MLRKMKIHKEIPIPGSSSHLKYFGRPAYDPSCHLWRFENRDWTIDLEARQLDGEVRWHLFARYTAFRTHDKDVGNGVITFEFKDEYSAKDTLELLFSSIDEVICGLEHIED
jgi:hypothetical protein